MISQIALAQKKLDSDCNPWDQALPSATLALYQPSHFPLEMPARQPPSQPPFPKSNGQHRAYSSTDSQKVT